MSSSGRRWRLLAGTAGAAALTAAPVLVDRYLSPWPAALLIRTLFESQGRRTAAEIARHAPTRGVVEHLDLRYAEGAGHGADVFTPAGAGPWPTVVWVHGGAWISGRRADVAPYLRILAGRGLVAVGVDYRIAPGARYPAAVHDVAAALDWAAAHAAEWGGDPGRLILAGDSAGAQLASQVAVALTEGAYAERLELRPVVRREQLRALVLHCGVYDLPALAALGRVGAWGLGVIVRSLSGVRGWESTPIAEQMSTLQQVTDRFPPTFVGGGNADPLTRTQSQRLAGRLRELGVPVAVRFWEPTHKPPLGHEFQFHLDLAEARQVLEDSLAFLREHAGQ